MKVGIVLRQPDEGALKQLLLLNGHCEVVLLVFPSHLVYEDPDSADLRQRLDSARAEVSRCITRCSHQGHNMFQDCFLCSLDEPRFIHLSDVWYAVDGPSKLVLLALFHTWIFHSRVGGSPLPPRY